MENGHHGATPRFPVQALCRWKSVPCTDYTITLAQNVATTCPGMTKDRVDILATTVENIAHQRTHIRLYGRLRHIINWVAARVPGISERSLSMVAYGISILLI